MLDEVSEDPWVDGSDYPIQIDIDLCHAASPLFREIAFKALLRGAFFFPFTLSVVTVGLTWLWLLDPVVGPFNYYLRRLGISVGSLLADPQTAM